MNTEHERIAPDSKETNNSEVLNPETAEAGAMTSAESQVNKHETNKAQATESQVNGNQASEAQATAAIPQVVNHSFGAAQASASSQLHSAEVSAAKSKGLAEPAEAEESETYTAKSASSEQDLSMGSKLFGLMTWVAPIFLCALAVLQAVPLLLGKELYALYDLGEHVASGLGQNFEPVLVLTPALYWLLDGLAWIPSHFLTLLYDCLGIEPGYWLKGLDYHQVIPLAAALGVVLGVLGLWLLALAVGNSGLALASGLVWLVSFACLGLPATAAPELALSWLILASLYCLFMGWQKHFAPIWLSFGFLLTALCFLMGGIYGFIPLITSLVFLIWRGSFRRAGAYDGALAFGLMLIALAIWAYMAIFIHEGQEYFYQVINGHIINPLQQAWAAQGERSWQFLVVLAILWLPWLGVVLCLPWYKLGSFAAGFWQNRTQNPGRGFIWCALLSCLMVLGVLGEESVLILLITLPFLAILTAQAVLSLSQWASQGFFLFLAGVLLVLGLVYAGLAIYPMLSTEPCILQAIQPWPLTWEYTALQVAIFIVGALVLWKFINRSQPKASLLGLALLLTLMVLPLAYYIVPARELVEVPVVAPEAIVESISVPMPEAVAPEASVEIAPIAEPIPAKSAPESALVPSVAPANPSESAPVRQEQLVEGLDTAN